MVTGIGFTMTNIRGKRSKPGLKRQHLICVLASAEICNAQVKGAELNSQTLSFVPDNVKSGNYNFKIEGAGSTVLVAQTILMPLLLNGGASVTLTGGTHNPMAPSLSFFEQSFLTVINNLIAPSKNSCYIEAHKIGFAPKGGGNWKFNISNSNKFDDRRLVFNQTINNSNWQTQWLSTKDNPNAQLVRSESPVQWLARTKQQGDNLFMIDELIGVKQIIDPALKKIDKKIDKKINQLASIDEHLANQIMLWMSFVGGGQFKVDRVTNHINTNAEVINQFAVNHKAFSKITVNQLGEVFI